MRRRTVLRVMLAVSAALVLGCVGCEEYVIEPERLTVAAGKTAAFRAVVRAGAGFDDGTDVTSGTVWTCDGKTWPDGRIKMDKPGVYVVTAVYEHLGHKDSAVAELVVTAAENGTGGTSLYEDPGGEPAAQADPSKLDMIFEVGNLNGVENGGTPPTFTIDRPRRIRLLYATTTTTERGRAAGSSR